MIEDRPFRRGALLAATLLTGLTMFGGPVAASPSWTACPENPRTQCTSMPVPVDWDQPGAGRFGVAIARRTVADPARRLGTLIYLPAGPGSSGVDAITNDQEFAQLFPPQVSARFDVLSFDPRGVRRSNAILCDPAAVDTLDRPTPTSAARFDALLAAQATVRAGCRAKTGPVFDHVDSIQTARDVDAIRTLLGDADVNLYGLSYGTVVGETYAERFPGRIRTLTLDGTYDHSASSDRFVLTEAAADQETFDQFVTWCAASTACELHGQDVRQRVAKLFTAADKGTLHDPADPSRVLDPPALTDLIVSPLARPDLPATAHEIATLGTTRAATPGTGRTAAPVPLPIYIQCADTVDDTTSFAHATHLAAAERKLAPDVRSGAYGVASLCIDPPTPPVNPQHTLSVHGAPPILVMNSRYDPSTPYAGAQRIAAQIGNAVLLTYDGMGHGTSTRTACTENALAGYLTTTRPPAPGTHCAAA